VNSRNIFSNICALVSFGTALFLIPTLLTYAVDDVEVMAINAAVSNFCGPFGAWVADFLRSSFGYAALLTLPLFCITGLYFLDVIDNENYFQASFSMLLLFFSLAITIALISPNSIPQFSGGYIGYYLGAFFTKIAGSRVTLVLSITINTVCLYFSGILLLLKTRGVHMFTFLKSSPAKENSTPKRQSSSVKQSLQASYVHIPLHSQIRISRDAKMPWITRETILRREASPLPEPPSAPVQSPFPGEPALETSQAFLDEFKTDPDFNMDINEIKIPANDTRIFMKDAFFDEHALDMTKPFNDFSDDRIEVVDNMGFTNKRDNFKIFDALEITASDKEFVEESANADNQTSAADHFNTQLQDDFQVDNEPELSNENEFFEEDSSILEESANIARSYSEPPPADVVIKKTEPEPESNHVQSRTLSAQNLRVEKEDETEGTDYHNKFFTYGINDEYIIPSYYFGISKEIDSHIWKKEIERNSELLVKTLQDFGIESKVARVNRGPVITLYEIQIAAGVKVNRVSNLSDDIAMALAASRVRIVAPIPGKSAVGVEIPNRSREMVTIGDIFNDSTYQKADMQLKVGIGKDILGKTVMLDLKTQPHLLIAGATGSGKSVCVNTLISSLVFNYDPDRVRFIMVDPKMVELQLYNGLPHQLTPVITEPDIAPKALKWAIYEMERRYRLLSEIHTRDIERYNQKVESYKGRSEREKLPYIVIIVDELADLMMVAPKEVENYITRIAQKARAVGIHLVLATQRPSVDVITGIIKANFPARIAFQVAQKTDSRTILDQNGAETLLGKGDMLYQSPTSSFPVRIQGAYISEDEIIELVRHAQKYGNPHYIDIEEEVDKREAVDTAESDAEQDEMFVEAMKIIEVTQKASASYLQRRLSIGYNRAARIIERMEELGYVGPQQGSKPRDVLI
jgi:DNA segregation ATPase FtsK/SpoIIIE-like protein